MARQRAVQNMMGIGEMTKKQEEDLMLAQQALLVLSKATEIAQSIGHDGDEGLVGKTAELADQSVKLRDMARDARGLLLGRVKREG